MTNSWWKSWRSLLAEPHTETVNILSHLLGALAVAGFFAYSYRHLAAPDWFGLHPARTEQKRLFMIYPFPGHQSSITYFDSWAFSSFYTAAFLCFAFSATYHASTLHSEAGDIRVLAAMTELTNTQLRRRWKSHVIHSITLG